MPGKDGVTHARFQSKIEEEIDLIISRVRNRSYRFTRFKEVLISRGHDRLPRQISIPTIRDRLLIRSALEYLKHYFPEGVSPPPHRYIKEIKDFLSTCDESNYFLRMDIKDFYPTIDHSYLLSMLKSKVSDDRFIDIVRAAIKTPTGECDFAPKIGVPQGLAISNILASIYMREFDAIADSEIFYRRYADDILVIASAEQIIAVHSALEQGLLNLGLTSHSLGTVGKTEMLRIGDGVQYLGYELSKGRTSIRSDSLSKMFNNLAKVLTSVRRGKNRKRDLFRLNLKITGCIINNARRGWIMFFSQTEDLSQLSFLDRWLAKQLGSVPGITDFECKSFRKAYYEIRYNLIDSSYIPNFDKFDLDAKADTVAILSYRSDAQVEAMDAQSIESEFNRLIGREISELERDIMRAFS